jgi:hypothetical protein
MISLIHALPLLSYSPMFVSIGIRKAFKVVITLREDTHSCVQIALQAIPKSILDELERRECLLVFDTTKNDGNDNLS